VRTFERGRLVFRESDSRSRVGGHRAREPRRRNPADGSKRASFQGP
jgi:hypothetical protein